LVITGATTIATGGSAHAATAPGIGSSYAQSMFVLPHDGALAVGVILGEALAGHTNYTARAQSQGTDLGSIGLSLTSGDNCGQPPPLKPSQIPEALQTETGAPGAAQGLSQTPSSGTNTQNQGTQSGSFGSTEFVLANNVPYGEAVTSYAPVSVGPITVSGMVSKAQSGLQNGQRVADATSDIAALSLVGGMVQLDGLHWESTYPSGGTAQPTAGFSVGKVLVSGKSLPTDQSIQALQDAINAVLGKLGIQLFLPITQTDKGVLGVTPLQIEVVPNSTRDAIIAAINDPTQGVQQTILGGLENGFSPSEPAPVTSTVCQSDTPITVGQITIASVDGGGYFSTGLGGVNSSSGATPLNAFNLSEFKPGFTPGTSSFIAGTAGSTTAGTPGTGAVSANSAPGGTSLGNSHSSSTTAPANQSQRTSPISYGSGGPLLAIGLAGLALLGLLAEGDRRMMRRAQRTIQFEE
jgi:hypothetical protein